VERSVPKAHETIRVERSDGIATISIARPEKRNALTFAMLVECFALADDAEGVAARLECRAPVFGREQVRR
jgi:enoyl-CoA hydratase/carnithine racemase